MKPEERLSLVRRGERLGFFEGERSEGPGFPDR